MPDSGDPDKSSIHDSKSTSSAHRPAAVSIWKIGILLLCATYTFIQAVRLVFPSANSLGTTQPQSNKAAAQSVGELFGGITGFWFGVFCCFLLIRSLLRDTDEGHFRRGFVFAALFMIATVLTFGGVAAVFVGTVIGSEASSKTPKVAMSLRAGGIGLLASGALTLIMAFGRSRRTRVRAQLVDDAVV
jgi:hypothetical protein